LGGGKKKCRRRRSEERGGVNQKRRGKQGVGGFIPKVRSRFGQGGEKV